MATEITMPKLSDTMTEGSFIGWRKNVGERVERGDVIAEVETDKAVMELEAFTSGVLLKTMVKGGENVPVGTVLGLIGEPGEAVAEGGAPPQTTAAAAAPSPPEAAAAPPATDAPPQPAASVSAPSAGQEGADHEKASPMVRRMAREMGIDLSQVHGSGPEGRILQEDLASTGHSDERGTSAAGSAHSGRGFRSCPRPGGCRPALRPAGAERHASGHRRHGHPILAGDPLFHRNGGGGDGGLSRGGQRTERERRAGRLSRLADQGLRRCPQRFSAARGGPGRRCRRAGQHQFCRGAA